MSKKINESLDFGGAAKALNVPTPTAAGDAANKAYVDSLIAGLNYIGAPVRVAVSASVNVSSPGSTLDGVSLAIGDRVLLWGQSTQTQNGTYVFQGATSALARSSDTFRNGTVVVSSSDGNSGEAQYLQSTDSPTVGSTNLTFVKLPNAATQAGTGLSQSGNVISLTSPVAVSLGGTGATTPAAALAGLGAAMPNSATFGDGSSTSFTFAAFKSITPRPVVQVVNASTGAVEDAQVTITPGAPSGGVYSPTIVVTSENWVSTAPAASSYVLTVVG